MSRRSPTLAGAGPLRAGLGIAPNQAARSRSRDQAPGDEPEHLRMDTERNEWFDASESKQGEDCEGIQHNGDSCGDRPLRGRPVCERLRKQAQAMHSPAMSKSGRHVPTGVRWRHRIRMHSGARGRQSDVWFARALRSRHRGPLRRAALLRPDVQLFEALRWTRPIRVRRHRLL